MLIKILDINSGLCNGTTKKILEINRKQITYRKYRTNLKSRLDSIRINKIEELTVPNKIMLCDDN